MKEQPIKGPKEIAEQCGLPVHDPIQWHHISRAMQAYANQFTTPIQSGEERLFTLKETLEIWEASGEWEYRRNFGSVPTRALNKDEYFKEKFGILLSSRQNIQK